MWQIVPVGFSTSRGDTGSLNGENEIRKSIIFR